MKIKEQTDGEQTKWWDRASGPAGNIWLAQYLNASDKQKKNPPACLAAT